MLWGDYRYTVEFMEISEIIAYFLGVLFPAIFVWCMLLQKNIGGLETEIAVNKSKDEQLEAHVLKMESKLDALIVAVNTIREEMAAGRK